jgi:hypothetical protein
VVLRDAVNLRRCCTLSCISICDRWRMTVTNRTSAERYGAASPGINKLDSKRVARLTF